LLAKKFLRWKKFAPPHPTFKLLPTGLHGHDFLFLSFV
jgi:hypothetical protein